MKKHKKALSVFDRLCDSVNRAEAMSTDELTTALAELKLEGGEHIASIESAVKGEAIWRLKHPFWWRFIKIGKRLKRHADTTP